MKFPIDIEAWIQEFMEMYPGNSLGVSVFRTMLPFVNDAYRQGMKDGRSVKKWLESLKNKRR